jgi:hypothetical protein
LFPFADDDFKAGQNGFLVRSARPLLRNLVLAALKQTGTRLPAAVIVENNRQFPGTGPR